MPGLVRLLALVFLLVRIKCFRLKYHHPSGPGCFKNFFDQLLVACDNGSLEIV